MSLLLEALKRAEQDFQGRKKAAAGGQVFGEAAPTAVAPVAPTKASIGAGMALAPPFGGLTSQGALAPSDATTALSNFPELYLAEIDPPFSDELATSSMDRTPTSLDDAPPPIAMSAALAQPAHAVRQNDAASPPTQAEHGSTAAAPTPTPTPTRSPAPAMQVPIAPATPRQAITAAAVLAGSKQMTKPAVSKQRVGLLSTLAALIAAPVAAFWIWGDQLVSTVAGPSPTRMAALTPVIVGAVEPSMVGDKSVSKEAVVQGVAAAVSPVQTLTFAATAIAETPIRDSTESVLSADRHRPKPKPQHDARHTSPRSTHIPKAVGTNTSSLSVTATPAKPISGLEAAYAAYQAGRAEEANQLYREVLKNDPTQTDAWLGLAVIAHANNQRELANNAYKRVLRLEPQNPTALAGMNSLNNNTNEPKQESRLRELLAQSPQEADLNHALGVVLSSERRWSEAQPLFFKAHALSPQEPQYAYNLAVTLDHLRKSTLAAQYYETALALANGKAAAFDERSARARLAALKPASLAKYPP